MELVEDEDWLTVILPTKKELRLDEFKRWLAGMEEQNTTISWCLPESKPKPKRMLRCID